MQLDEMVQYLIGIGAAIGADCQPCLQTCIAMAKQCGADEQQTETAAAVGEMVRQCAAKMRALAGEPRPGPAASTGSAACCGAAEVVS